jgi:hypothetical protein
MGEIDNAVSTSRARDENSGTVIDNKRRQQPLNRLAYSDKVSRICGIREW